MRSLVVSDLHHGLPAGTDLLRDPAAQAPLVAALDGVDRLVLLGDVLELRQVPQREAARVAAPVFAALGAALGPDRELLVLAGNHDHAVVAEGLQAAALDGRRLGLEQRMTPEESGRLARRLAEAARPARVGFAYPGAWLREDVYALHGHYLDVHTTVPTVERLVAGTMARWVARRGVPYSDPALPEAYEAALAPHYAWLGALTERTAARDGGRHTTASERVWTRLEGHGGVVAGSRAAIWRAGLGAAVLALNATGAGPLHPELTRAGLLSGGLHGIREVVRRLGIDARHVVFGHTHRSGPLAGDELGEWTTWAGGRLHNTGSWVHQAHFLRPDGATSPYRPGTAILVPEAGAPERLELL